MKSTVPLLALLPTTLLADVVILKSGGRVSGRIVQRSATSVEVDVGTGTITLALDRVERIEESRSALEDYYERAGRLGPGGREGWLELARWASSQSLSAQAAEAYHRVLTIDPANAEANQALGNVQVNGRWVSEAESYQARGYIQYQGEWMTPAQRDALVSSHRAQTDAELRQTEAEARARDAEAQAAQAEADSDEDEEGIPLGWGSWGPGPGVWPGKPGGARGREVRDPRVDPEGLCLGNAPGHGRGHEGLQRGVRNEPRVPAEGDGPGDGVGSAVVTEPRFQRSV